MNVARSISSRVRTLIARVSDPSGFLPSAKHWTQHTLQNRWRILCVLNRYSVRSSSSERSSKSDFGTNARRNPFLSQNEQLHSSTGFVRSRSTEYFTARQWQLQVSWGIKNRIIELYSEYTSSVVWYLSRKSGFREFSRQYRVWN